MAVVQELIRNVFKSTAPLPVKIIAWYFLLNGIANIIYTTVSQSIKYNYSLLHYPRFLEDSIPGIISNDPFSHGVITAIPLYDSLSILLKSLATISILLFAGYKLLRMEKQGWLLGIYIVAFGLLFSTIIYNNPVSYIESIFGGINTYGVISSWTVMSIVFLINIFALIYLPTHKKLFENPAVSGQKITLKDCAIYIVFILILILNTPGIISRLFPSSTTTQQTAVIDETVNWKTYTGDSFSIKYEKEYTYLESTTVSSPEYLNAYPTTVEFRKTSGNFTVTVAKNVKGFTLNNALGHGPYLSYIKDFLAGKDIKKIKIDNVDAVLVEDLNVGRNGVSFDIIAIKDSNIYQLESDGSAGIAYQDFNQILSTFKFTDQKSAVDTSNWKTYSDLVNLYTVKYSPDWAYASTTDSVKFFPPGADLVSGKNLENVDFIHIVPFKMLEFNAKVIEDTKVNVADQLVSKVTGIEIISDTGTLIHVGPLEYNGRNYLIVFTSGAHKADQKNIDVFNQMLSTFKFK